MVADRFDRLVGQRLTHVSGEIELHVCGFAVVALRSGLGERITPEVLDVLDVLGCPALSFSIRPS